MPSSPGNSHTEAGAMHAAQVAAEETPAERRAVTERDIQPREGQAEPATAEPAPRDYEAELAGMEDRYKRALADLDNYRKRSEQEVGRRVTEDREAMLRQWLEAVDSVERAMRMHPSQAVVEGMQVVLRQMQEILARQGVEPIGAVGEPFDPERHEAVAVSETGEVPDRSVAEVVRSGYAQGDRVVRPAQVVVGRAAG